MIILALIVFTTVKYFKNNYQNNESMFLSVIIPVYNSAKHITNCLNSIWAQELGIDDYEVICVDDCSTDNTVSVLYSISKEHNNLRIIKNDINRRAGGSRNHGVLEAKGEYVVLLILTITFIHAR